MKAYRPSPVFCKNIWPASSDCEDRLSSSVKTVTEKTKYFNYTSRKVEKLTADNLTFFFLSHAYVCTQYTHKC